MKRYDISKSHKEELYNIVLKLPKKTDLQKERFIRYYGLKPQEFKKETLTSIARDQLSTTNAIRSSIISIRIAMFRISDEDFSILEKIYAEHNN